MSATINIRKLVSAPLVQSIPSTKTMMTNKNLNINTMNILVFISRCINSHNIYRLYTNIFTNISTNEIFNFNNSNNNLIKDSRNENATNNENNKDNKDNENNKDNEFSNAFIISETSDSSDSSKSSETSKISNESGNLEFSEIFNLSETSDSSDSDLSETSKTSNESEERVRLIQTLSRYTSSEIIPISQISPLLSSSAPTSAPNKRDEILTNTAITNKSDKSDDHLKLNKQSKDVKNVSANNIISEPTFRLCL